MIPNFSTTTEQHNRLLAATLSIMLVFGAVAGGMLLVGTAAAEDDGDDWDEILNSDIETTDETDHVEFDLVFADFETDDETDEETVELTIYDEADWQDDEVEETAVLEETVIGTPEETVTHQYSVGAEDTDDLEANTEYRVIVEAENANHIESGYVAPDDELIGGATFGTAEDTVPGFGIGVGVAAVAIAVAGLARVRGGARVE
ncbi:hypothetical protein ACYJ1Y_14325 [Natrialbaceae archaeon A-gly3]